MLDLESEIELLEKTVHLDDLYSHTDGLAASGDEVTAADRQIADHQTGGTP